MLSLIHISKKFRAEHEADILLHQTAKKAFDELGMKKLPTVKSLQAEYAELMAQKKAAYSGYRQARDEMKELLTVKANVDRIMGYEEEKQTEKDHEMCIRDRNFGLPPRFLFWPHPCKKKLGPLC